MNPLALVTLALAIWGWTAPIHVAVDEEPAQPGIAVTVTRTPGKDCTITLGGAFYQAAPQLAQEIITHEVGHCLGLGHTAPDANSIMRPTLSDIFAPTPLDYANLAALYPRHHYTATVAGLSSQE